MIYFSLQFTAQRKEVLKIWKITNEYRHIDYFISAEKYFWLLRKLFSWFSLTHHLQDKNFPDFPWISLRSLELDMVFQFSLIFQKCKNPESKNNWANVSLRGCEYYCGWLHWTKHQLNIAFHLQIDDYYT